MISWPLLPIAWDWLSTYEVDTRRTPNAEVSSWTPETYEIYRAKRWTGAGNTVIHGGYVHVEAANGEVIAEGEYRHGQRQGPWRIREFDGCWTGAMKDDHRSGIWKFHTDSGDLEQQGEFVEGRREGVWSFWHEGEIEQWNTYERGRLVPFSDRRPGQRP